MTASFVGLRLSDLRGRIDAGFALNALPLEKTARSWPAERLGDLLQLIQYGSSSLASMEPTGTPMLRMNNLQDDGWDLTDLKYVKFSSSELQKYQLVRGDVLINRTNGTRELVGKSQVFKGEGEWVFASYLIRMRFDESRVLPEFVVSYLNSDVGRAQVSANSRQILQTNISASELKELVIPVPPIDVQEALVRGISEGLANRDARTREAAARLDGIGNAFMDLLSVPAPASIQPNIFSVRLSDLASTRFDANSFRPVYAHDSPRFAGETARLDELAEIDPFTGGPQQEMVPYAGLPQCDFLDVRRVVQRPLAEVRSRKVFKKGDLLFARIEPSVFNLKYPWARSSLLNDLDGIYTSTEFYVLRSATETMQAYLFAALRSSFVRAQVAGRTTGSSGRRRIDKSLFASIIVPTPSPEQLEQVSGFVLEALDAFADLTNAASSEWLEAKQTFAKALIGSSDDLLDGAFVV